MKKAFLSILFISFLMILGENVFASGSIPAKTQTPRASIQSGTIRMNTMSPATFRYPKSYTNASTRFVSNNNIKPPFAAPNSYNGTNVNIYVGTPVYVMHSGMVRIKHRPRKGRVGTLYPDIDYYEY